MSLIAARYGRSGVGPCGDGGLVWLVWLVWLVGLVGLVQKLTGHPATAPVSIILRTDRGPGRTSARVLTRAANPDGAVIRTEAVAQIMRYLPPRDGPG